MNGFLQKKWIDVGDDLADAPRDYENLLQNYENLERQFRVFLFSKVLEKPERWKRTLLLQH